MSTSLNFRKINPDDKLATIAEKVNENYTKISENLEGLVGATGEPGQIGFTGPRGRVGPQGTQGDKGTIWYRGNTISDKPQNPKEGDFFLVTSTGSYFRYESGVWVESGTLNFEDFGLMLLENQPKNSTYQDITQENVLVIVNKMTNQTLLLSNFDRPNATGNVQIPDLDSPGETYPIIQGNDTTLSELYDYKLNIWNSGDAQDSAQRLEGRNIHIGNSFAMKTKDGWMKASGFTISSNLDASNTTEDGSGVEILEITGVSDGTASHTHKMKLTDCDFFVGTFNVSKTGNVTVGFDPSYTASQKFDVNGGIKIGTTNINVNGSIRFKDGRFQGYRDTSNGWVNLDLSPDEVVQLMSSNVTAYKDKLIDTSNTGGVIFGNASIGGGTPKQGTVRYNSTTDEMEYYSIKKTKWISMGNQVFVGTGGTGSSGGSTGNGSGFEDQDGNPIASKIVIEVNTDTPANEPVYDGFVVTSKDESVTLTQDLIDGKYASIDISVNGGMTSGGGTDGNAAEKVTGIDIISDDIEVKRTVEDGTATYKLALPPNSAALQEAVNKLIDFRSPDGSVKILPPEGTKNYWQIEVTAKGGASGSVDSLISQLASGGASGSLTSGALGSIFKNAISRYKKTSGTVGLAYNSTYLGHIGYLPLDVKDFDENCYIVSTNPYELKVQSGMQGYYHIDSRVRFTLSSIGTFKSVRLVVLKNGTEILTLAKATKDDFYTNSFSASREFELSGSDSFDMTCTTEDCSNSIKVALIVDYDTTSNTATATLKDSNVTVNKVASVITAEKVDSQLSNSNTFYKTIEVFNSPTNKIATLESKVYNANVRIKPTTYGNVYVESNNIYVGPNVIAISEYISANLSVNPSNYNFTGVKVVGGPQGPQGDILLTKDKPNIWFEGGTDVTITPYLTPNPKLKVEVNKSKFGLFKADGTNIGGLAYTGNIKAGEGIDFSEDSGNVVIKVSDSISSSSSGLDRIVSSYVDFCSENDFVLGPGTSGIMYSDMAKGIICHDDIAKDKHVMALLPKSTPYTNPEYMDRKTQQNPLGITYNSTYPYAYAFKPNDSGLYEVTLNVDLDIILYSSDVTDQRAFTQCITPVTTDFWMCELYDSGTMGTVDDGWVKPLQITANATENVNNLNSKRLYRMGGVTPKTITGTPLYKRKKFASRNNMVGNRYPDGSGDLYQTDIHSVSRNIVISLNNEKTYGFGMNTGKTEGGLWYLDWRAGADKPRYSSYNFPPAKPNEPVFQCYIVLYNTNYIIKKID